MTQADYGIFGPIHFGIMAVTPVAGAVLAFVARRSPAAARATRLSIAWVLVANEIATQAYRYQKGWVRFPDMLPLQLSDLTLWITIAALFTLSLPLLDIAYYLGIVGAGNATITPELWGPITSLPSIQFFVAHAGVVAAALFIVWTPLHRPRPRSIWLALATVNGWAVLLGVYNAVFQTNYMFLCRKPATASLLDSFGPWPVYLLVTELVAVVLFALLWLPYRRHSNLENRGRPSVAS